MIRSHSYPGRCNMNLVFLSAPLCRAWPQGGCREGMEQGRDAGWCRMGLRHGCPHSFPAPAVPSLQLCRGRDTKGATLFLFYLTSGSLGEVGVPMSPQAEVPTSGGSTPRTLPALLAWSECLGSSGPPKGVGRGRVTIP